MLSACTTGKNKHAEDTAILSPQDKMLRHKYRGIYGVVLRVDASSPKEGVIITSEAGWRMDSPSLLSLDKVDFLTYTSGSMPVPKFVRATWRTGKYERNSTRDGWNGGTIIGDYTVPAAERIPDEILDDIRTNGGALRLKIRLKDNGLLIGWDVEKRLPKPGCKAGPLDSCLGLHYLLPGGDFREAQIFNGKVIDPGWEK
jgi:hypothetical protein